jgi:pSer/pThr/pTyr-binding forkhead associated (FHA) protein
VFELSIFLREHLIGRSTFDKEEVRIGRSADNEVQIDNMALSRYHASIEVVGGAHIIKDFGTPQGTFVNGEKITAHRALGDGDRIQLGKFALLFRTDKKPAPTADIRDEASFAVAGETLVMSKQQPMPERPCPWAGYLEGEAVGGERPPYHPLAKDLFVIGSAPGCDLIVPSSVAAARAALIVRAWTGFTVVALGSQLKRNGVVPDPAARLSNGDELGLGPMRFWFRVGRDDAGL